MLAPSLKSERRDGLLTVHERGHAGTIVGRLTDPRSVLWHITALTIPAKGAEGQSAATAAARAEERSRTAENEIGIAAGRARFEPAQERLRSARAAIRFRSGSAVVTAIRS